VPSTRVRCHFLQHATHCCRPRSMHRAVYHQSTARASENAWCVLLVDVYQSVGFWLFGGLRFTGEILGEAGRIHQLSRSRTEAWRCSVLYCAGREHILRSLRHATLEIFVRNKTRSLDVDETLEWFSVKSIFPARGWDKATS